MFAFNFEKLDVWQEETNSVLSFNFHPSSFNNLPQ